MREGLENGFPVKLLRMGLMVSEFLGLGFDEFETGGDLSLLRGIESKLN